MILLSILLSCADKDTRTDTDTQDTSESEGIDTSIAQFKAVYCEEYAMRCNLYETVEDCETVFNETFDLHPSCEIVDKETFDICADWLLSLDCNVQGWIDECNEFYSCPE